MTRTEWLVARQQSCGSSDTPNLCGCGFRDALSVYRDKTEPPDDRVPTEGFLARGIALEPLAAARYEQVMGVAIVTPARYEGGELVKYVPGDDYHITRHPLREWQSASIDRRRADNGSSVELKTVAGFSDEWGENGSADVPRGYLLQATKQMGVTGRASLDLGALDVIDWSVRVFRIDFDPRLWEWITEVERKFWFDHVLPRVPPPADWDDRINPPTPVVVRPGTIDLGPPAVELLAKRKRLMAIRDEADGAVRTLTEQVVGMMGESERGTAGGFTVKRVFVRGGQVSYARKDNWQVRVTGKGEA